MGSEGTDQMWAQPVVRPLDGVPFASARGIPSQPLNSARVSSPLTRGVQPHLPPIVVANMDPKRKESILQAINLVPMSNRKSNEDVGRTTVDVHKRRIGNTRNMKPAPADTFLSQWYTEKPPSIQQLHRKEILPPTHSIPSVTRPRTAADEARQAETQIQKNDADTQYPILQSLPPAAPAFLVDTTAVAPFLVPMKPRSPLADAMEEDGGLDEQRRNSGLGRAEFAVHGAAPVSITEEQNEDESKTNKYSFANAVKLALSDKPDAEDVEKQKQLEEDKKKAEGKKKKQERQVTPTPIDEEIKVEMKKVAGKAVEQATSTDAIVRRMKRRVQLCLLYFAILACVTCPLLTFMSIVIALVMYTLSAADAD